MTQDIFGPPSGTPDGTTQHAHVANVCLPAGLGPNTTPIFISVVIDTRNFLTWLRAYCSGGLMARLKGKS